MGEAYKEEIGDSYLREEDLEEVVAALDPEHSDEVDLEDAVDFINGVYHYLTCHHSSDTG